MLTLDQSKIFTSFLTFLYALFFLAGNCLAVPLITRGPYLQKATPGSIVVRWRTDTATDSVVRFGTTGLNQEQTNSEVTTEHRVELNGLSADTIYYYSIGSSTELLLAGDPDLYFHTSPLAASPYPARVWVVGDSGRGNDAQRSVLAGYLNYAARTKPAALWLMLGDNAYFSGRDGEYQVGLFDIYQSVLRNTVLWPTLGNHDGLSASSATLTGPYYEIFSLPRNAEAGGLASGTEAYYSFDYAGIHFICLNSYDVDRASTAPMARWLVADLQASTAAKWRIAFWHHPPYSKGSHNSDTEIELVEMRENIVPLLEDGGVDLVLAGHSHSYERSFLIDGHYGNSTTLTSDMLLNSGSGKVEEDATYLKPTAFAAHRGTVYVVAGTSSAADGGSLSHPIMYKSASQLGSLVLDIDPTFLDGSFITPEGNVFDTFRIEKSCPLEGPCPALPETTIFASSQKTDFGKSSGTIQSLNVVDKKSLRLQQVRVSKKNSAVVLIHRWNFQVPAGFGVSSLHFMASVESRDANLFRLEYSLDGVNFYTLGDISFTKDKSSTFDVAFPYQLQGDVTIRLSTSPLQKPTKRRNEVRINYLALQ